MFKNREEYLCLSAMLRAREPKLLNAERAGRMLDAPGYEEAAKLLSDCGYEDMSRMSIKEVEAALNNHRKEIFDEVSRLCPDREITGIFSMKYDYHNAKVIIKSEAMGISSGRLFSEGGRISPLQLEQLYAEEKYSSMPGKLGEAMAQAKALLARTSNPQLADFLLDRFYFGEVNAAAKESGNAFLQGYAAVLTDTANLKSAVRTMRMGKNGDFLRQALIPGGSVDADRVAAADKDGLAALYASTELEKAAALAAQAAQGEAMTAFELECDNAVNTYLKKAKLISFGSESVTAYLAAVENEITAVRMILTGRLAGVSSDVIRERLRDMYA